MIARHVGRTLETATVLWMVSGLFLAFGRFAYRAWDDRLAREATAVCEQFGGTALVAEDRVVSCLQGPLPKGPLP